MGTAQIWRVKFQVVRVSGAGKNTAYDYRREVRSADVQAANPAATKAVLDADITGLVAGETIEIISIQQASFGTEGVNSILT
jgi:hypothetical protein